MVGEPATSGISCRLAISHVVGTYLPPPPRRATNALRESEPARVGCSSGAVISGVSMGNADESMASAVKGA